MRNHSQILLGLAALSSVLLVGCGGSSSSSGTVGSTNLTGGATLLTKSVTTAVPSSNTPSSQDFQGTTAVVPAGVSVPANVPVAILTGASPILNLQGTSDFRVNGISTGVGITNGTIASNVALPPSSTPYYLSSPAPTGGFLIPGDSTPNSTGLTINSKFTFGVPVRSDGTAGIPTSLSGTVPTNGSSSASVAINATYPAAFAGYQATLALTWTIDGQLFTIAQTQTVGSSGTVSFSASESRAIATKGADTISLVLNPAN